MPRCVRLLRDLLAGSVGLLLLHYASMAAASDMPWLKKLLVESVFAFPGVLLVAWSYFFAFRQPK